MKTETKNKEKSSVDLLLDDVMRAFSKYPVMIVALKDRYSIVIDDIKVAAVLRRSKAISIHLSKFKPESTTFDKRLKENLVSYGLAGYFFNVDADKRQQAVRAIRVHFTDLARIREIREKGI